MDFSLVKPVVARSVALAGAAPLPVFGNIAVLAAYGVLTDYMVQNSVGGAAGLNFGYVILTLLVQVYVVHAIVAAARPGIGPLTRFRLLRLFGQSILMGIGVLIGLVLLILPGIYIAARWYIAASIVIMEDGGAVDSMTESWNRLETHWPTTALLSLIWVGMIAIPLIPLAAGEAMYAGDVLDQTPMIMTLVINLAAGFATVASYVFGATTWLELSRPESEAQEIFG